MIRAINDIQKTYNHAYAHLAKKELEFAGQLNMIYDFIYIISRFILFLEVHRKKKSIENCKCRAAVSGK